MEEIIKILEEHNIKCVQNGNDLSLSHKNFYINIENVNHGWKEKKTIHIINKTIHILIFTKIEHMHVSVL